MINCEVCAFQPRIKPEFVLYDGTFWNANLRHNDQTLLGTFIIAAKRHVPELHLLTEQEEAELIIIRNALIQATDRAFHPLTFNVSSLGNDAFKADPDNTPPEAAHVHWHVKPRYTSMPVQFAGETFQDPMPGRYLSDFERHKPSQETAVAIADALRSNLAI